MREREPGFVPIEAIDPQHLLGDLRGCTDSRRSTLARARTAATAARSTFPFPGSQAHRGSTLLDRHPVRASHRDSVGVPAQGDGLWQWRDVLAQAARLASRRSVGEAAPRTSGEAASSRETRLVARSGRLVVDPRDRRGGKKAGRIQRIEHDPGASTTSSPMAEGSPCPSL